MVVGAAIVSCRVPGDMVFNIQGNIIDESGAIYRQCRLQIIEGDNVRMSREITGEFEESIVLGGLSLSELFLQVDCKESEQSKKLPMPEMPSDLGEYIELGEIILPRD